MFLLTLTCALNFNFVLQTKKIILKQIQYSCYNE